MKCVICVTRRREPADIAALPDLEHGHVCDRCPATLRRQLADIVDLVALVGTVPDPMRGHGGEPSSRPHPGSRPPLDVARLDPALILVETVPGDPSSAEALLPLLESWERAVREDRAMAPYGLACDDRDTTTDQATLAGVCGFLAAHVDWMAGEPTFSIDDLAAQVRRALAALRALDPNRPDGYKTIPCPADHEAGVCGYRLRVEKLEDGRLDLHGDIRCPRCRTTWTAQRLLLVALSDDRVTIWAYPSEVEALGVPKRTLRRWGHDGVVPMRGSQYDAGAAFRRRHDRPVTADAVG